MKTRNPSRKLLRMALLAVTAAALGGSAILAERTRFWRQSSYEEFEKGTAEGVALRSDGKLVLAPRFAQFADPNLAYLWALAVDSKGVLYAAGGSDARVLRFDAAGKATTVFESQEMAAQALAVDRSDNLYVGTSPDGKVYRITPSGEQSVFFEPGTKYIWDLAVAADGTVYVATGDKGEIFAVRPTGEGRSLYKSEETHARALALDREGRLIVGTEPNGLVMRIETAGEEVRAFVLHETDRREVTALAADAEGNLYAASVGAKSRRRGAPSTVPQPAPQTTGPTQVVVTTDSGGQTQQTQTQTQTQQRPPQTTFVPFRTIAGGSEVYRIAPDGAPQVLWSSREELVYTLGLGPAGKLLLGTGNKGLLIQLEDDRVFSHLAKTASAQVTGLAAGPEGKVFVATANPGNVFTLGPGYESEGTFESEPLDAKIFSHWGRISWWGENGSTNGKVEFYVRSGNTSDPGPNWSPWAGPYRAADGQPVSAPPARFVQWKAVFKDGAKTARPGETPNIVWVNLAYLPKNLPPEITAIAVQDPGVRAQSLGGGRNSASAVQQPVQLRLPQSGSSPSPNQPQQGPPRRRRGEAPPQGFTQRGMQAVLWSAEDPNDDDLVFALYYRGEGEGSWKLLKDEIEETFYSWDTTTMPDGAYYLKIVASDGPSNPPAEALSAERTSERFEVDNTPPQIAQLQARPASPEVRVQFAARDSASIVARAEYSLDAGEWKLVLPTDRLSDAREKNYAFLLRDVPPGEHTLAVRVYDRFENSTTAKVTFTVAPSR